MQRRQVVAASGAAVLGFMQQRSFAKVSGRGGAIKLGQSAPLTGPLAPVGIAVRDSFQAVLADFNAAGGLRGRMLELVSLDDEDRSERTAVNVKLLASQHEVVALCGFVGAGAHRAGARGANEENLSYVAPVSGSQELRTATTRGVYNMRASHQDELAYIVRHTRQIGIRRLSLVTEYNPQGWELRDGLIEALQPHGQKLASMGSVDQDGSPSTLPDIVAALLAGAPEAILLGANHIGSALVVAAARKAGFNGLFYTLSTVGGTALMQRLGPLATGLSITQVVPFPWSGSTQVSRDFQAFCGRHKVALSFSGMEAYLSANLLIDALKGTRDGTATQLTQAFDSATPRDFGGFIGSFYTHARRTPVQVDLTVYSASGKFVR